MKKAVLTWCFFWGILLLAAGQPAGLATTEPETLFQGDVSHSFYFAPSLMLTRWQDRSGFMVGGKVAWVLNQKFGLGLAGYGLTTRNNIGEVLQYANNVFLQVGYGGALLEYTPNPSRLLHFSFPLIIGVGGAAYTNSPLGNNTSNRYSYEVYQTDTFFVMEPGVQAELNMARFMRLGLAASYRFAQGVDLSRSSDRDMSAPTVSLTFKFGKF
ncbi:MULTISPECIES: hypothetical protein [Rufibacter]|uniref:Outer membrane protein beta-barrel domain-containing protein n=1 Tax=Rufibacter quisquiliarum TaxID=1549639 RepID=A0A839GR88_9BACT|nr:MULTISPECIES: hypothetical protein [Rufibacter]MBA9076918.1 hypothetical protein [Rufibacter quisquiliarum]